MRLEKQIRPYLKRWLPEVVVLCLGMALYGYQLDAESFWIDEILSVESAQGPLNLNRPLYFIALRYWMQLGQSDAWLRSLSVLFGLGCIALTYQLGRKLATRQVGLAAALLFTLSPLAINHAQEVRFYMMSTFLGVAGSLFLSEAFQFSTAHKNTHQEAKQRSYTVLFGWIVCRCLGFLTAQPNLLLLLPDLLLIGSKQFKQPKTFHQSRRYWIAGALLLSIPTAIILSDVLPELWTFLSYTPHAGADTAPGIVNLIGKLSAITVWPLRGPEIKGAQDFYAHIFNLYSVVGVGLLFFWLFTPKLRTARISWAGLWGLSPICSIFLLAQAFPVLWQDRYALISAPYIAILLAAIGVHLWNHQRAIALLVAALYMLSVSGPLLRYYTLDYRADWRGLAQELSAVESPAALVIVYPNTFVEILDYYYDGKARFLPVENTVLPENVNTQQVTASIQRLLLVRDRVWLICPTVDQWGKVEETLIAQLEAEDIVLQRATSHVDQWSWGPMLYEFSAQQL